MDAKSRGQDANKTRQLPRWGGGGGFGHKTGSGGSRGVLGFEPRVRAKNQMAYKLALVLDLTEQQQKPPVAPLTSHELAA